MTDTLQNVLENCKHIKVPKKRKLSMFITQKGVIQTNKKI